MAAPIVAMRELDSYLNDHLAGSVGALELIDHWSELERIRAAREAGYGERAR